jgi:hypothetical protein
LVWKIGFVMATADRSTFIYFIAWTDNNVLALFGHRLADVDVASVPEAPAHHRHP